MTKKTSKKNNKKQLVKNVSSSIGYLTLGVAAVNAVVGIGAYIWATNDIERQMETSKKVAEMRAAKNSDNN